MTQEQAIAEAIQRQWPERIGALKELLSARIDQVQRIADERQGALKTALDLYATENHRRLEILNGEAGRLREMQSSYVPREVYDRDREMTVRRLQDLEKGAATQAGRGQVIAVLVSAGISIVTSLAIFLGTRALR